MELKRPRQIIVYSTLPAEVRGQAEKIVKEIRAQMKGTGEYTHNIISAKLRMLASVAGKDFANRVADVLKLDLKFGIVIPKRDS